MEILKFGADWCEPCHKQDDILDDIETDATIRDIDVESEDARQYKRKYTINALPTIIILDDGTPIKQFTGLASKEDIVSVLDGT